MRTSKTVAERFWTKVNKNGPIPPHCHELGPCWTPLVARNRHQEGNRMKTVFISAPYTAPDPCVNTRRSIDAAEELIAAGFVPFVPHLTHFWHTMTPHPYEFWMRFDLHWLEKCDAVLRLPGESSGADRETACAVGMGIPVFDSISELKRWAFRDTWSGPVPQFQMLPAEGRDKCD